MMEPYILQQTMRYVFHPENTLLPVFHKNGAGCFAKAGAREGGSVNLETRNQ